MTFSCCVFGSIFLAVVLCFFAICWSSGSQKGSKCVSLGDLGAASLVKVTHPGGTMVPRWLPDPQNWPFGVTLGCLLEVFWGVFNVLFYTKV